jgi:hypothetical protein
MRKRNVLGAIRRLVLGGGKADLTSLKTKEQNVS